MALCPYKEKCCMKERTITGTLICTALCNTNFKDGKCHFRKLTKDGPNEYDKWRRKNHD